MPVQGAAQLDRATCLALLASSSLGRLVFTHRALPDVLPVNYRLDGENIVIRLAIDAIAYRDAVVAFAVDEFDDTTLTGWSVTAVGHAHEIVEPDARTRAILAGLRVWRDGGQASAYTIAAQKLTGRRLFATP